ncbi:PREDICTED: uncharacterized protein LOC109211750 [Nicotiana attenuata]|uniref:uncharacterized protein LOC109211750 n=1 Tax=Nicotiana attenuata TaxID=49451 RepID=UPI000904F04B|nr:PREDICTED: uncharacterized protein LOC109211750 [Nicotiana attenuata]
MNKVLLINSLFTKKQGIEMVIILIYVDDLLITGSKSSLVQDAKMTLHSQFKVKDLGELRHFLGIEVMRSKRGILLNQRKHTLQLISQVGLSGSKHVTTPPELNQRLTTTDYESYVGKSGDPKLADITTYQQLIGKLLYLIITQPDISFHCRGSCEALGNFDALRFWVLVDLLFFIVVHLTALLWILDYVGEYGSLLEVWVCCMRIAEGPDSAGIIAYCDSDWAACPNIKRSVIGYVIKLGSSLISWKSKKQQKISRRFAEAEYRSMAADVAEVTRLSGLLDELGIQISNTCEPTLWQQDNYLDSRESYLP